MRRVRTWFLAMNVLVLSVVAVSPVRACVVYNHFDVDHLSEAKLVFQGELTTYERVCDSSDNDPNWTSSCVGYVTFKVLKTLRGNELPRWRLYWENATFGIPKEWKRDKRLLVAAVPAEYGLVAERQGDVVHLNGVWVNDQMKVLQDSCSAPFFLPADADTEDLVRGILAGKTKSEVDPDASVSGKIEKDASTLLFGQN